MTGEANFLDPEYAVTRLNYVGSQEPGALSLEVALDTVNRLLSDNDVGSSQDADTNNPEAMKLPPISSAKRAQTFVWGSHHRNLSGRTKIFDWPGNVANEANSDKTKAIYPENQQDEIRFCNHFKEARHLGSESITSAVDRTGVKEGSGIVSYPKMKSSTHLDSREIVASTVQNEKSDISETKSKDLFSGMDNSNFLKEKLELNDVEVVEEMDCVGPNTQMAAEAMEALFRGSSANLEFRDDAFPAAENITEVNREIRLKKALPRNVSMRKRAPSSNDPKRIVNSKRRKVFHTRPDSGIRRASRECSSNTTFRNVLAVEKEEFSYIHLNTRRRLDRNEPNAFSKKSKTSDGTFAREISEHDNSVMINGQVSASKEFIPASATHVAHQTRQSKYRHTSNESSPCMFSYKLDEQMEVSNPSLRMGGGKFAADSSGSLRVRRKGHVKYSNQITESMKDDINHLEMQVLDRNHKDDPKTSSTVKGDFSHPKKRRTQRSSCKGLNHDNSNDSLVSDTARLAAIAEPCTQPRGSETSVNNLIEILDRATRKKRSVSTCMPSNIGGVSRKVPVRSYKSTLLIENRPSSKADSEKASTGCLTKPLCENGSIEVIKHYSATVTNDRVPLKEIAITNQGAMFESHVEDVRQNAELEENSKDKFQSSGLICTRLNTSPSCMSSGLSGKPCDNSLLNLSKSTGLNGAGTAKSASSQLSNETRRRKSLGRIRVLFSNNLDESVIKQQRKILAHLRVLTASSISDATHFITEKFARTKNMLEAIAMGKPVVTRMWLESCSLASCFIDEKEYILRDLKKEKELGFSLPVSLARASRCPLLQGWRVFVTPNVKPEREIVANLIKVAHGQLVEETGSFLTKAGKISDDLLVISCEEDYAVCTQFLQKGAEIFSAELLLNGIVIQKLEFERHRLFVNRNSE